MMAAMLECPHCGTPNPAGSEKCRLCGKLMNHIHTRVPGSIVCSRCGQPIEDGEGLCNSCTTSARQIVESNLPQESSDVECVHWSDKPSSAGRSARVAMAGVLILMAGALGIGQAVIALSPELSESMVDMLGELIPAFESASDLTTDYVLIQAWSFIAGILALVGGVFALTETRYGIALSGGVFSVLAIGFVIGAVLGLFGLLLLAVSRKDFLPEC